MPTANAISREKELKLMQEPVRVTGMVLEASPVGETDRRVVLLTKERGKISAFARGARKQGSRLMAATNPFCFGEFVIYEGRNSYSLSEAVIANYFEDMRTHFEEACYGMSFSSFFLLFSGIFGSFLPVCQIIFDLSCA